MVKTVFRVFGLIAFILLVIPTAMSVEETSDVLPNGLFKPEFIVSHHQELQLTDKQRQSIMKEVQNLQAKMLQLPDGPEKPKLLFSTVTRINNVLTPAQKEKLKTLQSNGGTAGSLNSQQPPKQEVSTSAEFTNPQRVVIQGYSGSAEEPYITPDGQYLLFDDRTADNDPPPDIYYAKSVNDTTFTFIGKVEGVNTSQNEASPHMDDAGNLYFITNRSYNGKTDFDSVYRGTFKDGVVTGVVPVKGVSAGIMGWVDMDAQISLDGRTLYVSDADHTHGFPPASSIIKMFTKNQGGTFTKVSNSDELLKNVNAGNFSYAPSISRDGLELFFVRFNDATKLASIFVAKRSSISEAFGDPQLVAATDGFVESPSLSGDQKHLYYHQEVGRSGNYVLYMLTRQK